MTVNIMPLFNEMVNTIRKYDEEVDNISYDLRVLKDENVDLANQVKELSVARDSMAKRLGDMQANKVVASFTPEANEILKEMIAHHFQFTRHFQFKKINAIKFVRDLTGWGLLDAKNYVESIDGFEPIPF